MTAIIGILNLTPDSFSDGGTYNEQHAAIAKLTGMVKAGADVIDIGAESTRPGATPLSADEEWARLSPILPELIERAHAHDVLISLDTRHASTAARAIHLGVDWINDVSCARDDAMLAVLKDATHVRYVLMHSLTVPANKQVVLPPDCHVIYTVRDALMRDLERLHQCGITKGRVIVDAGLGFGKTAVQSLRLLWDMPELSTLGCELLAGHSRKSCFMLASADKSHRDALTMLASAYLMHRDIDYLRVHDVVSHATLLQQIRDK